VTATVSVVIPCYNAGKWLEQTLDSVHAQTHPQLQVIVVDDGSVDDSPAILERWARSRPLTVIRQENRGQTAALNRGLAAADGDFIQYLDADDLLHPEKIAHQVARLSSEPDDCIATAAWGRFVDSPSEARPLRESCWRDATPLDWIADAFRYGGGMMFPAMWLLPRRVVAAAGPWREDLSLNNDAEYFVRALRAASRVCFVGEAMCYYRSAIGGSLSSRRDRRALLSNVAVIESIEDRLRDAFDDERIRRGVSMYWQRFAVAYYPDAPDIADAAYVRALALHPERLPLEGGWRYRWLARILGWRRARRFQRWSGRK
jgi:glycosyltransferase involved in cell wall biosynthesis